MSTLHQLEPRVGKVSPNERRGSLSIGRLRKGKNAGGDVRATIERGSKLKLTLNIQCGARLPTPR
jgi:hypothetical protein